MASSRPIAQRLSQRWGETPNAQRAIVFALAATFVLVCLDSCAKAMSERYSPLLVVWWRYVIAALISVIIFAPTLRRRLRTQRLGVQIIRSGLLFGTAICLFYGFAAMPLADVEAILQLSPLLITGFAALFLGETVGPWRWVGVAAGLAGALLIIKPGFSEVGWAAIYPLMGAVFFSAYGVATRFLSADEDPWTTFVYTGSVGAMGASVIAPFVWVTPQWEDVPFLLGTGVFGALGQGALMFAFILAPASLVAPLLYVGLIWAALFGYVFFGDFPDNLTIGGAAVIVAAGMFVQWREMKVKERHAGSP